MMSASVVPPDAATSMFATSSGGGAVQAEQFDAHQAGRVVAVLVLLQMAGSFAVNFVLEAPLFGTPGFLTGAAGHASQIALGAIVGLITEAFALCIAVAVFPIVAVRSRRFALWLVAWSAVVLAVAVGETVGVMSMVSLSQSYAGANPADRAALQAVRVIVSSARNWTHFLARMLDGAMILSFYVAMRRLALLPAMLATAGILAALLQIAGLGVTLFGHDPIFPMMAPLGLVQLVLIGWLVARGFGGNAGRSR